MKGERTVEIGYEALSGLQRKAAALDWLEQSGLNVYCIEYQSGPRWRVTSGNTTKGRGTSLLAAIENTMKEG